MTSITPTRYPIEMRRAKLSTIILSATSLKQLTSAFLVPFRVEGLLMRQKSSSWCILKQKQRSESNYKIWRRYRQLESNAMTSLVIDLCNTEMRNQWLTTHMRQNIHTKH